MSLLVSLLRISHTFHVISKTNRPNRGHRSVLNQPVKDWSSKSSIGSQKFTKKKTSQLGSLSSSHQKKAANLKLWGYEARATITGWWYAYPSEKYGTSIGMMTFPIYEKISGNNKSHVPVTTNQRVYHRMITINHH